MSQVNLNGVVFYLGDADRKPMVTEMPLTGIEKFFPDTRFPAKGITFIYGHRNPAIPYLLRLASIGKQEAVILDVDVEVGNWLRMKIGLTDDPDSGLANTRFLSVHRARRDILDVLEKYWFDNLPIEIVRDSSEPGVSTAHPYLFDGVLSLDAFKHLAVIAYSVKTPEIGVFQVATVFDKDAIFQCNGGHILHDVSFVL